MKDFQTMIRVKHLDTRERTVEMNIKKKRRVKLKKEEPQAIKLKLTLLLKRRKSFEYQENHIPSQKEKERDSKYRRTITIIHLKFEKRKSDLQNTKSSHASSFPLFFLYHQIREEKGDAIDCTEALQRHPPSRMREKRKRFFSFSQIQPLQLQPSFMSNPLKRSHRFILILIDSQLLLSSSLKI